MLFDSTGQGNNIDLGTLGGNGSYARSVNNEGQIVGGAITAASEEHCTIFDANGIGNNIAIGADGGAAWGNNDAGQIVGWVPVDLGVGIGVVDQAAIFEPSLEPSITILGGLGELDRTWALSINNGGAVVGLAYTPNNPYLWDSQAVLFDSTGGGDNINLGTLPGYDSATAFSINDQGQIVGRVNMHDMDIHSYFPRAVLFDPNGEARMTRQ